MDELIVSLNGSEVEVTPYELKEARAWLEDCVICEFDIGAELDEIKDLSDGEVVSNVNNFFEGGWSGFLSWLDCLNRP